MVNSFYSIYRLGVALRAEELFLLHLSIGFALRAGELFLLHPRLDGAEWNELEDYSFTLIQSARPKIEALDSKRRTALS